MKFANCTVKGRNRRVTKIMCVKLSRAEKQKSHEQAIQLLFIYSFEYAQSFSLFLS